MKIGNCSRCGQDHEVQPMAFTRPFAPPEAAPVVWSKWATCPTTGDPILISERAESDPQLAVPNGSQTFEDALEVAYWIFDARYKGTFAPRAGIGLGPQSERDAFKAVVRELFGKWKDGARAGLNLDSLIAARLKLWALHNEIDKLPVGQLRSDMVHTHLKLSQFIAEAVGDPAWKAAAP